ncbi:MAG: hypothetical protein JXA72_13265 [Bacteroidales bacterium]|nr:hypothetical protein [Bacteroidales bacterium]
MGINIPSTGLHLGLKPQKKRESPFKYPGMNAGAIDGKSAYHYPLNAGAIDEISAYH